MVDPVLSDAPATGIDICLAPLRGITTCTCRDLLARRFGGIDRAVAPFIPTVKGMRVRPSLLADVEPDRNRGLPLIPQAIGKDPAEMTVMLAAWRDLGYRRADLNAGCPWPMVVRRGRGCGLMADADRLRRMLDAGCAGMPGGFSIKVRLGVEHADLLAPRMEILNAYPLCEVIIHPRTARQMYEGRVDLERFAHCLALCRHPVVYNGDLRTVADGAWLRRQFPRVTRWMIGRGLIADPFLAERLRGQTAPRDLSRLRAFLDELLALSAAELPGDHAVLGRLKELWGHLAPSLRGGERLLRTIHLCRRVEEYERVVDEAWGRAPEWEGPADGLSRGVIL